MKNNDLSVISTKGLSSNFMILDYQVEIQSRMTSEIDQQSWYQVAAYNSVKQISNLKLHESLWGNVTSVHLCGFWSHCYTHMRGLEMLKVSVMTQWMFVTTADLLYQCYIRNCPFTYINLTCWEFPVLPFSGNCHYRPTGTFIKSPISFLGKTRPVISPCCLCVSQFEYWTTNVTRIREIGSIYRILIGKPKGVRPLKRPCHRWDSYIILK
jgi:hypothetical protein